MDYVDSINTIARDIYNKGLQGFLDDAIQEACDKESLTEDADLRIQYPEAGIKVELQSDTAEEAAAFARAILGDNYDCFDCDFTEVAFPEDDADLETAPVTLSVDLEEPVTSEVAYVDPFEQDIFDEVPEAQSPVTNQVPEFAPTPEVDVDSEATVATDVTVEQPAEEVPMETDTAEETSEIVNPEEDIVPSEAADPEVVSETEMDDGSVTVVEPDVETTEVSEEEAIIDNLEEALDQLDDFATQIQVDELPNNEVIFNTYACIVDNQVIGYVEAESEVDAYAEMERQYPDLPYNYSDGYCTVELVDDVEEADDMTDEAFVEAVGKMIVDNRKNK